MDKSAKKNWKLIKESLPLGDSKEAKVARIHLFKCMDQNNNGTLSLNEIHTGIKTQFKIEDHYNSKTAIFKAFEAVRISRGSGNKLTLSDQFLIFSEFKKFLSYLKQYLKYFEMFDRLDSDCNKKIDLYEFIVALPVIEKWGLKIYNPQKTFLEIDVNNNGAIVFDEFCYWAIKNKLHIEADEYFHN